MKQQKKIRAGAVPMKKPLGSTTSPASTSSTPPPSVGTPVGMMPPLPYAYIGIVPAPGLLGAAAQGNMGGIPGMVQGIDNMTGSAGSTTTTIDNSTTNIQNTNVMNGVNVANGVAKMPVGFSEAFLVIYKLTVMLAALIFVFMVWYGVLDIILYIKNELAQRIQRTRDPNIFNKDTTDIKSLSYITSNSLDDEMYHIYQQQRLIAYMFVIAGIMIIMFGIQMGTFFSLKMYAIFTQREFKEQLSIPTKLLATMAVMVTAAVMIKGIYKKHFIKKVQASLRDLRSQLRDIRIFIYNNMSNNSTFLAALRSDNIDDIIDTIATVLQNKESESCTDKLQPCDTDVERMLFTLNLYSYLKVQVPDSDPNYDKIRRLFEVDGVNNQDVDPTLYFYYKQPTYITNLYPIMRERLKKFFGTPTGKKAPNDYTLNPVRERIFLVSLNNKMQDLNSKLTRMYNLATGKNKVRGYLFTYLFYVLFFALILIFMFFQEAKPFLVLAKEAISKALGYTGAAISKVPLVGTTTGVIL